MSVNEVCVFVQSFEMNVCDKLNTDKSCDLVYLTWHCLQLLFVQIVHHFGTAFLPENTRK